MYKKKVNNSSDYEPIRTSLYINYMRSQCNLTYSDLKEFSIPKLFDIFHFFVNQTTENKKTNIKDLTVEDMEQDF